MGSEPAAVPLPARNNFGALRLLFAYLVLLSHSPELVDGNRSREILTRVFHTLSFGELAVDAFFIISGYLITQSYLASSSNLEYLAKRVLRIYPGFVAAVLLCVFVVNPAVGGRIDWAHAGFWRNLLTATLTLRLPAVGDPFTGNHYPSLNQSLWTIKFEFVAYLLLIVAGWLRLLSRRWLLLALTLALFIPDIGRLVAGAVGLSEVYARQRDLVESAIRFFGLFAAGSLFWLFRDRIRYRPGHAAAAAVALGVLMGSSTWAHAATASLGAYLIFYVALRFDSARLSSVGRKNDLSYGVYLYAWPVQSAMVWVAPSISPWLLFVLASLVVTPMAYLSWAAIERPALRFKGRIKSRFERGGSSVAAPRSRLRRSR